MPCGPRGHPAVRFAGCGLLALCAVTGLGGLLGGAPPGLVLDVPVDGLLQAPGEVGVGGLQPSSRWSFVESMA